MDSKVDDIFQGIVEKAKIHFRGDDEVYLRKAFEKLKTTDLESVIGVQSRIGELLETAEMAVDQLNLGTKALVSLFLSEIISTDYTLNNIEEEYGSKTRTIVDGIIKVRKIDTTTSKLHSENFIKLLLVQANDVRVVLLLLVEKMFLSRYIKELSEDDRIRLCNEFTSLYAPLAHRLGLYAIKLEMEEQSLKFLHNDIYKTIAKKLAEKKKEREEYIKLFIQPIEKALLKKGIKFSIKGRPKSIHSIWKKLNNNNVEFDKIYDLFAIRIIIDTLGENEKADCWMAYSVVSDIYLPNPKRLRDWISTPKSSAYESLHTTVMGPEGRWVEVQIRTTRMDEVAEKGHAAHWKYKEGANAVGATNWLGKIREALENPSPDAFEQEHTAKIDLYSDEIFIFTPNGDLKKMPAGSTVLDFAYEVHTNIGSTCTGGKINDRIVSIKHVLANGDKLEILTSKNQTPKRDWLSFVKTNRAKSKIRKYIKESQYQEAEAGKEQLMRKLNQLKIKFSDESVFKLIKHYKAKDALDLYLQVVNNKVDFSELKSLFSESIKQDDKKPEQIEAKQFESKIKRKITSDDNFLILDEAVDNIDFKLAKCCNPIHGDEIFGFVSATGGIKIHRLNCPNAHEMTSRYPYRIIKASWNSVSTNSQFLVGILVTGSDEIGIISHITQVISQDMKVNMREINISSNDGNFEGKISIYIRDIHHLDNILIKLKSIKGVHTANRYEL